MSDERMNLVNLEEYEDELMIPAHELEDENAVVSKVIISYTEYESIMEQMVQLIVESGVKFSAVHGLPRGGLPIAVHLSHYMHLPMVINIQRFKEEYPDGTLLVVDDIIDTGKTFERFLEIASIHKFKYKTATLFYKPHSAHEPDIYINETTDWIVFPWEVIEDKPNREAYEHLGGTDDSHNYGI